MHADGTSSGFAAVRSILEYLPISFLWAPLLRVPLVRRLGDTAYEAVAGRRRCALTGPAAPSLDR